jgi:hypothetical protein
MARADPTRPDVGLRLGLDLDTDSDAELDVIERIPG